MTAPDRERCRAEIEQLHAFFVDWYCGAGDFQRVEQALAPAFERIDPDGTVHDRAATLESIRQTGDQYEAFDIDIRNVTVVDSYADRAMVRYEEWQTMPDETNGRLSTVLLVHASGAGTPDTDLQWQHLQETWLD